MEHNSNKNQSLQKKFELQKTNFILKFKKMMELQTYEEIKNKTDSFLKSKEYKMTNLRILTYSIIFDTNYIVKNRHVIQKIPDILPPNCQMVLPYIIVSELDDMNKKYKRKDIGFYVRDAMRILKELSIKNNKAKFNERFMDVINRSEITFKEGIKNDDKLIESGLYTLFNFRYFINKNINSKVIFVTGGFIK